MLSNVLEVLPEYLAEVEDITARVLVEKTRDEVRGVSVERYILKSQVWPKEQEANVYKTIWEHSLIIYRPDVISTTQALLFVNGGTCHPLADLDNSPPHSLDFARLAVETHSIIVDLQDVPNQYLILEDGKQYRGDALFAHCWNRYMDDTQNNKYSLLSLPMTKAVIKAMDAVQQIMLEEVCIVVEHFLVAGISKRGLATWLAALVDERINAIVPVAIDILNTKEVMQHIYTFNNDKWPVAFQEFVNENIPQRMSSKEFSQVVTIEDPVCYLQSKTDIYKKRLSIPKYIINASGDDFFPPDCLNYYLSKLPGETRIRYVPNQSHFIHLQIIEDSLLAFYRTIVNRTVCPQISWKMDAHGLLSEVSTDKQPMSVKLWEAENPLLRDFRWVDKITYHAKDLKMKDELYAKIFDYSFQVMPPTKGWKAYFVEMSFQGRQGEPVVITTPAFVVAAAESVSS